MAHLAGSRAPVTLVTVESSRTVVARSPECELARAAAELLAAAGGVAALAVAAPAVLAPGLLGLVLVLTDGAELAGSIAAATVVAVEAGLAVDAHVLIAEDEAGHQLELCFESFVLDIVTRVAPSKYSDPLTLRRILKILEVSRIEVLSERRIRDLLGSRVTTSNQLFVHE